MPSLKACAIKERERRVD